MQQPSGPSLAEIDERLAVVAAQIGELVVEHTRLLAQRHATAAVGDPDPDRPPPDQPPHETDRAPLTRPGELSRVDLARLDRVDYVTTMRAAMMRALYTVDAALVDGRFDRTMLRAARKTLVEAVDAADATLLLDDAAEFQPDWTEDG